MKRIICLVFCILLLAACGKREPTGGTAETPDHIYREVSDTLLIDCEIVNGPDDRMPKVYEAQIQHFSEEQILQFLEWNHASVVSKEDTGIMFYWDCEDGSYFSLDHNDEERSPYCYVGYTNPKMSQLFSAYPFSANKFDAEMIVNPSVNDMFTEQLDLPFMSRVEAEREVRSALGLLGLHNLRLYETLCIPHEKMMELDELMLESPWNEFLPPDWSPPEHIWTEEDDCYRFEYFATVDGYDLSYRSRVTATTAYVGASVVVDYTPIGIVKLRISGMMEPLQEMEEMETTTTAMQAIDLVTELYENKIANSLRTISDAQMVYVYEQNGSGWLLRPVWEITICQTIEAPYSYTERRIVRIDAVSGKIV